MKIHCNECNRYLGDYLYGKGGVEERAMIVGGNAVSMPDIICYECDNTPRRLKIAMTPPLFIVRVG